MEHISKYSEQNFGLPINPSGGKINPKTGERRDENPELGVDKPDWRSGQLESQSNPDAVKKMAEGGDVPQTPASPSPGDPNPDKAKAAIKGLNQPADQQLSEGWQRLLHPSTWWAEGGKVDCMAEGGMTSDDMGSEPTPMEAARITPEQVDKAQEMAMGTMGTTKMAVTPQNLGPELQATATKLSQALEQYGINHQVTQTLAQKLKGLHSMLSGTGMADGGEVEPHASNEPPASLNANAEDLSPTGVPTDMAGMSMSPEQKEQWDARQAYQKAHDMALHTHVGQPNYFGGIEKGTPEDIEKHAVEQGLNNVALMKEDKASAALQDKQKQLQTSKLNTQLAALGLPPMPGTNQPNAVDPTPGQPEQPMMARANSGPMPQASNDGFDKTEGMINQGYHNQLAGINKAADVAGQRGDLEQQALEQDMQHKQAAAQSYQDAFKELNNERLAHVHDVQNGHIDPEQYWKGTYNPATKQMEGGHSKLLAAIGMIIGGFDPAGTGNGGVQMLQYQMNRNLDAQKMNLQSKQNLLTANLHQFGNLRDAMDMTRVMQTDMVANHLKQAATKTASPAAKAAALNAAGQLQLQVAPLMQQFAMRRAFMKLANGADQTGGATEQMLNYMDASGMPQAKEMRDRYVPGLGIAATPVPQETKDRIAGYQNVERTMNQALQFAKEHEYNLNALDPREEALGATIQNELLSQIRQAEKQGVYKESEAKFMHDTLGGNPASFFNAVRTQPKLMQMQQMKTNEYHNLLQNLGGGLLRNAQAVHAQVHTAPAAPQQVVHDASGKPFVRQIINGKAYMVPVNN